MKQFFAILLLFFIATSQSIKAHDESQPPFVFVNNIQTTHSTIQHKSVLDFFVPHDVITNKISANDPITFTMQPEKLIYDAKTYIQTRYEWDLGDGTKSTKMSFKHSYKKTGSYIVSIDAIHKNSTRQRIFSSFIHIVPNQDYSMPKPNITVTNNDFSSPVTLNGSTPNVMYYFWDLGDGTTNDKPVVTHTYSSTHTNVRPILRVKDSLGIIADASVDIINTPTDKTTKPTLINQIIDHLRKLKNKILLR